MTFVANWAALFLVVLGGIVLLFTSSAAGWNHALPFALELWSGAALLVLIGEQSWPRIAGASLVVIGSCLVLHRRRL